MTAKTRRSTSRVIAILTVPLLLAACSSTSSSTSGTSSSSSKLGDLTIASSNPMTGDSGYYGADKVKGMQLAVDEVNAAGGVNGRQVKLLINDDAGQPTQGASLAAKECANTDILAVIGHWNSSVTLAAVPIYDRCKLPSINDDTTVKLSGISPYSFRVFATGEVEGALLAQFAWTKGYRQTAVVYDTNDYGITLSDAYSKAFKALGGKIVLSDAYVEGNKNFAPDAQKVQSSKADSTFIAGYYVETALIAKAIRAAGITGPLMGGDGVDAPQLTQLGGSAVEGMVFVDDYAAELQSRENTAFVAKWQAKYGSNPDTFAALAYDSANLLIEAMKSGATDRDAIQKWLKSLPNFVGVTGPIKFDAQNNAARNVYMLAVKNGKIVLNDEQIKDGKLVPASAILK
jgi:branched-chain amino acid transport system substrate-binding protein